jgi:hypothetical protein
VFANRPIIASTPSTSDERPDTVVPKTTSSRPVSRPSTSPHAPWTTVFSVRSCARAAATSPSAGTSTVSDAGSVADETAGASSVGSSTSDSAARQAASAASWSRPASHSW